ncbi:MAG: glutamate racemase [Bacteroidota bacterium]
MDKLQQQKRPIGVFDSGIGGLTVANAISRQLPEEQLIYFGDTAHLPYGDKSADAIRYYCLQIARFLLDQQCKMIVIACNSASSAAYHVLLDFFKTDALFVNVVDPLVEVVGDRDFKKVGVIATKATISSSIYQRKLREQDPSLEVGALATPLLTPMIEEGYFDNTISQVIIQNYLNDPVLQDIDALLLACTHYPLIRGSIEAYYKKPLDIFDSIDVVAKVVEDKLAARDLLSPKREMPHRFYVSDYTKAFEETTALFYPSQIALEQRSIW